MGKIFEVTNERRNGSGYVLIEYSDSGYGGCGACDLGPCAWVGGLAPVVEGRWIGPELFDVEEGSLVILGGGGL